MVGPDLDGRFGSMQGEGGLENTKKRPPIALSAIGYGFLSIGFRYATHSRLGCVWASTQGKPSLSRASLGLNDAIPLGLNLNSYLGFEG